MNRRDPREFIAQERNVAHELRSAAPGPCRLLQVRHLNES